MCIDTGAHQRATLYRLQSALFIFTLIYYAPTLDLKRKSATIVNWSLILPVRFAVAAAEVCC